MSKDILRYDLMVQDALKGVVRKILIDAARDGLPGEHHFYITFRTPAPGVRLSQRLRERHPDEMTIVLQHQFWDLIVTDHTFEVGLSFSGVPERLLVPFDAVTTFFDPSVQFGLKFETQETAEDPAEEDRPRPRGAGSEPAVAGPAPATLPARASPPALPAIKPKDTVKEVAKDVGAPAKLKAPEADKVRGKGGDKGGDKAPADDAGAQVVSLDSFRKKT